jgi:hypothetical protein
MRFPASGNPPPLTTDSKSINVQIKIRSVDFRGDISMLDQDLPLFEIIKTQP